MSSDWQNLCKLDCSRCVLSKLSGEFEPVSRPRMWLSGSVPIETQLQVRTGVLA